MKPITNNMKIMAFLLALSCSLVQAQGLTNENEQGIANPLESKIEEFNKNLFEAIFNDDEDGVKEWLAKGANSNAQAEARLASGGTLLEIVNPDQDEVGKTPLMFVALYADYGKEVTMAELLVSAGAHLDAQDSQGKTALRYAVEEYKPRLVKFLLDKGAHPNISDNRKRTALTKASQEGYEIIVKDLLLAGADPNQKTLEDFTPLMFASYYGHESIVRLLLLAGANPDIQVKEDGDWTGETALTVATKKGYESIVRFLLFQADLVGLEFQKFDEQTQMTYIFSMQRRLTADPYFQNAELETIKSAGPMFLADPDIQNADGDTPLIIATRKGFESIAKALISAGADPDIQNNNGDTALMYASYYGYEEIAMSLLSAKADPSIKNKEDETALIIAARNGFENMIKALVSAMDTMEFLCKYKYIKGGLDNTKKGGDNISFKVLRLCE